MDKKKKILSIVIPKTLMFIFIMAFIIGFKSIFGDENTLIGVTTVTALLMFLNIDLTSSLFKNIGRLLIINVTMGVAAYISAINPWIGLPINFIFIFIINYYFYFNLKNSVFLPFILQYEFILFTPVTIERLPIRLASLLVTPILILAMQLLFNKGNKKKNKLVIDLLDQIKIKINHKLNRENNDNDIKIQEYINNLRNSIYNKRIDEFYITEVGERQLFFITALEKLWISLTKLADNDKKILQELLEFIDSLKEVINDKNKLDKVEAEFNNIISKHKNESIHLEIINSLKILKDSIYDISIIEKKEIKIPKYKIPKEYLRDNFNINSIKFSYVIRSAFGISLAAFIVGVFNLPYGKWMVFTVGALIVPIYEASVIKAKDR